MNLAGLSLVVPKSIMDEVDARQNRYLTVPTRAAQKGTGDKAASTWIELFQVDDVAVASEERKDANGNVTGELKIFEITFKVPDDSTWTENLAATHKEWWRVNTTALAAGNKKDGQYIMSLISLGRLKQLIVAADLPIDSGGGVDIGPYFDAEEGGSAPVVGARFYGRMKDKMDKDKDGVPVRRQEIVRFASESDLSAL